MHAYETWGFKKLSNELIDVLNIWAGFIYGPLLHDGVRPIAGDVKPGEYGRREAFRVHKALKELGPVTVATFDDTCGNLIQIAQLASPDRGEHAAPVGEPDSP